VALDRSALEEERSHWLVMLNSLLLLCLVPQTRAQARALLIWTMQDEAPYTAMTRCYLRAMVPNLAGPQQPHPRVQLSDALEQMERLVSDHANALRVAEMGPGQEPV
jgi:aconitase A